MSKSDRLKQLFSGSFIRDVAKLSLGTLGGRVIALAALPMLTRIYSPADFSLLATYLALVSTISVAACLRLEIAIPLVDTDEEAGVLLTLAILILTVVTLLISLPVLVMPGSVARWLGSPGIEPYLWLVPLGVAFAGSYSALQYWATRARRFGDIARTRMGQSAAGVSTMLLLGMSGFTPLGLLMGNMISMGAGGGSLAASARRHGDIKCWVPLSTLGQTLQRHLRYPLFSMPEAIFNIAGIQIPVLLIAAHQGTEAGYLMLAMQVMTAPMTLLGSSISQVFMSRAPKEYQQGTLAPFTLSIMKRLAITGIGPLVLVGALAPFLVPLIFGVNWSRSGEIVAWLVPWIALQFIASPVSMVMYVVGHQRTMLFLTSLGFCMRVGLTSAAVALDRCLVEVFALVSAIFYAVCIGIFIRASCSPVMELKINE